MGLVQQPLVARKSGCVFIYAYLSWERAERGALRPGLPQRRPALLPALWPLPWREGSPLGRPVGPASLTSGGALWSPRLVVHVLNALFLTWLVSLLSSVHHSTDTPRQPCSRHQ